jgi:hypothetical protein
MTSELILRHACDTEFSGVFGVSSSLRGRRRSEPEELVEYIILFRKPLTFVNPFRPAPGLPEVNPRNLTT